MGVKSLKKNQDAADIKEREREWEEGEIKRKQGKMITDDGRKMGSL